MAGRDPWAWLGLLKWSLSYSDGTSDVSKATPMSEEDKAFLEKVMKEGIIDENERMKVILQQFTTALEYYQTAAKNGAAEASEATAEPPISEDDLEDLLQELRDIVEHIDYSRAFMSMKGLPFLLGCIQERQAVPASVRKLCLGLIATLCQNNPPVQKELLELGALKIISDMYFSQVATSNNDDLKPQYMQAMSSIVRSHDLAESVLEQLEQAAPLFKDGLDPQTASVSLKRRTLFFLRAFITSDSATQQRLRKFSEPVAIIADCYLQEDATTTVELREMALELLIQILEQKKSVDSILYRKSALAGLGVQRISKMRADRENAAAVELESWEQLMRMLARATPDEQQS